MYSFDPKIEYFQKFNFFIFYFVKNIQYLMRGWTMDTKGRFIIMLVVVVPVFVVVVVVIVAVL